MKVKSKYYANSVSSTFGTFFEVDGGLVTADHVIEEMYGGGFNENGVTRNYLGRDIALIGDVNGGNIKASVATPGMPVIAYGYPAGSHNLESRNGTIYAEREEGSGVWIALCDSNEWPVVVGMSGGPVFGWIRGIKQWRLVGVLSTRNSPFDHDFNGSTKMRESFDFQGLI